MVPLAGILPAELTALRAVGLVIALILVVYAIVRRGAQVVAAGRAIVPEAPAGASTHFQLFFIGDPKGGSLVIDAPPSTLG